MSRLENSSREAIDIRYTFEVMRERLLWERCDGTILKSVHQYQSTDCIAITHSYVGGCMVYALCVREFRQKCNKGGVVKCFTTSRTLSDRIVFKVSVSRLCCVDVTYSKMTVLTADTGAINAHVPLTLCKRCVHPEWNFRFVGKHTFYWKYQLL